MVVVISILLQCIVIAHAANYQVSVGTVADPTVFEPALLSVSLGDTVTFVWAGPAPHDVEAETPGLPCTPSGVFSSGAVVFSPASFVLNINRTVFPGNTTSVPYFCTRHCANGMRGELVLNGAAPTTPPTTAPASNITVASLDSGTTLFGGNMRFRWTLSNSSIIFGACVPYDTTWVGVGVTNQQGGAMEGADISMMFFETGIAFDYYATSFAQPSPDTDNENGLNNVVLLNSYSEGFLGSRCAVWTRPLAQSDPYDRAIDPSVPTQLIAAYSNKPGFQYHGRLQRTQFTVNLRSSTPAISVTPVRSSYVTAHAVLMSLAFGFFLLLGTLVSTFLSPFSVKLWLPLHIALQTVGFCMAIAGFVLVVYFVASQSRAHFQNDQGPTNGAHQVIGMLLFSFLVVQIALGILADVFWRKHVKSGDDIPEPAIFPDKVHWWLGRLIVVLSVVQIYLGIADWLLPDWVYGIYTAWFGLLLLLVIVLVIRTFSKLKAQKRDRVRWDADEEEEEVPIDLSNEKDKNNDKIPADSGLSDTSIMEL